MSNRTLSRCTRSRTWASTSTTWPGTLASRLPAVRWPRNLAPHTCTRWTTGRPSTRPCSRRPMAPAACACGTSTRTPRFVHTPRARVCGAKFVGNDCRRRMLARPWVRARRSTASAGRLRARRSSAATPPALFTSTTSPRCPSTSLCLSCLSVMSRVHVRAALLCDVCMYVCVASGQLLTRAQRTDCFAQRPGVGQAGVQPEGPRLLVGSDPRTRVRRR